MKLNTKSSITLPAKELELVEDLAKSLGAKSKVEVIRRGLYLLKNETDREKLRAGYKKASLQARPTMQSEIDELDSVTGEGID